MAGLKDVLITQVGEIAAANAQRAAGVPAPTTPEEFLGLALKPGTRVLDTITGQEGTVYAATIRNTVLPTT